MARFGKPNATGRSSGKLSSGDAQLFGPPRDSQWAWLTVELLASTAWRAQSVNCRRLIDFLLIEHRNHAGFENGALIATYDQLVKFGVSRRLILSAICEAKVLGLIRVDHGGRWAMTNRPSTFTLTFYATKDGSPATNNWRKIRSPADAKAAKKRCRANN